MKKKLSFLILFFYLSISYSQSANRIYDFFGGKTYDNTTLFYRLLFEVNDGKISGYAFTDEQGKNESKSIIEGIFNANTSKIIFTETKKLLTKSKQRFNNQCYLQGTVTLKLTNKISEIKGIFIEQNKAGKKCRIGKIHIISLDSYKQLKQKIKTEKLLAKKENKPKPELKTTAPNFEIDKKLTIKDDEEVSIFWKSDTIKLDIWDDAKEDGDQITITFNDKEIIKKHTLKNKKKQIEISLKEGENKLVFTANNTGLIANNTARVDLFDKKIKHQIITQLQLNKSVTVYLIKQ